MITRILTGSVLFSLLPACAHITSPSQNVLKSGEKIPISAALGVPEYENTIDRFREFEEAGFTINLSQYSDLASVKKALDIAEKAGVKIAFDCPELHSNPEEVIRMFKNHKALAGFFVSDEPAFTDFESLGKKIREYKLIDDKHFFYVNLYPNYAPIGRLAAKHSASSVSRAYTEYLNDFLNKVPVDFVSFDHYPVVLNQGVRTLREEWYENLETIRSVSENHGLPFWAFVLSVAHGPYPIPTIEEIRLQAFSNLAYGAQGIQYFSYWIPDIDTIQRFYYAPIGKQKKRTEVYDRIKHVNEEIQALAAVFYQAKIISVMHTGTTIPRGTKRLNSLPQPIKLLETGSSGALVSLLEKKDRRFFVIVNRDFKNLMSLRIVTGAGVCRILKDGSLVPADLYSDSLEVEPGDMMIYTWEKILRDNGLN